MAHYLVKVCFFNYIYGRVQELPWGLVLTFSSATATARDIHSFAILPSQGEDIPISPLNFDTLDAQ